HQQESTQREAQIKDEGNVNKQKQASKKEYDHKNSKWSCIQKQSFLASLGGSTRFDVLMWTIAYRLEGLSFVLRSKPDQLLLEKIDGISKGLSEKKFQS